MLLSERIGEPAFAAAHAASRTSRHPLFARDHGEIIEMHVAVCLRPQADLSGDGLWQRVLKIELAIEIPFNLVAGDGLSSRATGGLLSVCCEPIPPTNADPFQTSKARDCFPGNLPGWSGSRHSASG